MGEGTVGLMALALTLLAGLFFLAGAAVAWRVGNREAVEAFSVAIAFGALACVAVTDLGPEAIEAAEELGWPVVIALVVAGLVVLIVLDRAIPDHHAEGGEEGAAHIGKMAVFAVSVHNVAEGAAIFTIASQDLASGAALAFGVGLHNAPLGMLLFSAFEGGRVRGTIVLSAAVLSTFAGGLAMYFLGGMVDEKVLLGVVCVALGMVVYILFAELLPSMIKNGNVKRNTLGVAIGAAFVLAGMLFG